MNARQVLSRSTEWVVQKSALREARAAVIPRGDRRNRAVCQARLLLEVARRVAEPVESYPPGSRPTVRLGLYRQAIYWTLVASRHDDAEPPSESRGSLVRRRPRTLASAARDDVNLETLKHLLAERRGRIRSRSPSKRRIAPATSRRRCSTSMDAPAAASSARSRSAGRVSR